MGYHHGGSFIKEPKAKSKYGKAKKGMLNKCRGEENNLPVCLSLSLWGLGELEENFMGQSHSVKLEFIWALSALR